MNKCDICPRKCLIDRTQNTGFCGATNTMQINKIMFHMFEEPILTNNQDKGSGAIFFSSCNLKCVFCQNYQISHFCEGKEFNPQELADIMKDLEAKGAGNIDLVSPTQYSSQIIESLKIYKPNIPVVWNSNGYESVETLKKLKGLIDIFLVDYKYSNNDLALKYSLAPNYNEVATAALQEMFNQQPKNIFNGSKLIKGIIVRHMVLPSHYKDSINVLNTIKNILGENAIISIMSQYTPMGRANDFPEINRKLKPLEYKTVVAHAKKLNLNNCFIQELSSASDVYTPNFSNTIFEI